FEVHAIPGAEAVREGGYERVFSLEGSLGGLRLEAARDQHQLQLHVVTQDSRHLFRVVRKLRQMFDLDSDPIQVAAHFSECSLLSGLSKKYPGLRIARGWDAFETSIGSVLGQLVSTEQARRMLRQLVEAYGKKVTHPLSGEAAWIFPAPGVLAKSSLNQVGTTNARKETIREFSRLVLSGKISLEPTQDPAAFRRRILMVKGIGPWTADYIALRALGDTDAFPGTDLILKRATELHAPDLETLRPWRGYAATYFWKEFAKSLSKKGKKHHEAHAIG
ncbi:MAG: DNA-3-methyladenine glycosylase family protein, partial [Bdellovibrionota bacterium]